MTGLESIEEDLKAFQTQLASAVQASMDEVGEDMKEALLRHINEDVYAVYEPKVYKRRSENFLRGTPLNDMDENTYIWNKGAGVTLQYLPTGEHETQRWSGADGDALVGRIERKDPAYNWGNSRVPKRPFFQNFVAEMTDEGELERLFIRAMRSQGMDVESDGTGVVREQEDGEY